VCKAERIGLLGDYGDLRPQDERVPGSEEIFPVQRLENPGRDHGVIPDVPVRAHSQPIKTETGIQAKVSHAEEADPGPGHDMKGYGIKEATDQRVMGKSHGLNHRVKVRAQGPGGRDWKTSGGLGAIGEVGGDDVLMVSRKGSDGLVDIEGGSGTA